MSFRIISKDSAPSKSMIKRGMICHYCGLPILKLPYGSRLQYAGKTAHYHVECAKKAGLE